MALGEIKAVSPEEKLALVSGGSDRGFAAGMVLVVLREGDVVGSVRVTRVFPSLSGCEVLEPKGAAGGLAIKDRPLGLRRR